MALITSEKPLFLARSQARHLLAGGARRMRYAGTGLCRAGFRITKAARKRQRAACWRLAKAFDGVFCVTDYMALGVLDQVADGGPPICAQSTLQIIGCDDIRQASWQGYCPDHDQTGHCRNSPMLLLRRCLPGLPIRMHTGNRPDFTSNTDRAWYDDVTDPRQTVIHTYQTFLANLPLPIDATAGPSIQEELMQERYTLAMTDGTRRWSLGS